VSITLHVGSEIRNPLNDLDFHKLNLKVLSLLIFYVSALSVRLNASSVSLSPRLRTVGTSGNKHGEERHRRRPSQPFTLV
jgi:hypothetical protein